MASNLAKTSSFDTLFTLICLENYCLSHSLLFSFKPRCQLFSVFPVMQLRQCTGMVVIGPQSEFDLRSPQNQPRQISNKVFFIRFEMPGFNEAKLFPAFKIMGVVNWAISIFEQTAWTRLSELGLTQTN